MQSYTHFTLEERESLAKYVHEGRKQKEIALLLGKDKSSVSREIRRNRNKNGTYQPWTATCRYIHRRKASRRKLRLESDRELLEWVGQCLRKYWPPETITVMWKRHHPQAKLSASTIYSSIRRGIVEGCSAKENLRRRGKRRYVRGRTASIQPEHTIEERCQQANQRARIGDWEGDTMHGARNKSFLVTCVERKSRFLLAALSPDCSAKNVGDTLLSLLADKPRHSLTLDNGSEFAHFRRIERKLDTPIFFAHPHAPWERGSNENSNALLRFFFPKSMDFSFITHDDLSSALLLLNNRPRKCLNWLSPADVFFSRCT